MSVEFQLTAVLIIVFLAIIYFIIRSCKSNSNCNNDKYCEDCDLNCNCKKKK